MGEREKGIVIVMSCARQQSHYSGGDLCTPQPWKHFVKRLDSLFFSVKNSLRGRSGCLIRMCCM